MIPSGEDADQATAVCQLLEKRLKLPEKPHPDNGVGVYWSIKPFNTEITVQGIFTTAHDQARLIKELESIHHQLKGRPIHVSFYSDGNERKHLIRSKYIK